MAQSRDSRLPIWQTAGDAITLMSLRQIGTCVTTGLTKPVRVSAGRLTLPAEVRQALGITGQHETVIVEVSDGMAILRPAEVRPRSESRHSPKVRTLMEQARRTGKIELSIEDLEELAGKE